MTDPHVELIKQAIPLWYAKIAWAKELLVRAFGLSEPQDILSRECRHFRAIPNTCWFVRPHGIGVDIFKSPDVGGVDFDFDKPDPDEWRLALFIVRQVNDGQLSYATYRELVDDERLLKQAVAAALQGA